jgi:hypothetical protein
LAGCFSVALKLIISTSLFRSYIVNVLDQNHTDHIALLSETEVDQVGGAIAPLVVYGLWMAGGAAIGFGAAAAVHYFGNGNHKHLK